MTSYFRLFCYFLDPKNAVEIVYILVERVHNVSNCVPLPKMDTPEKEYLPSE